MIALLDFADATLEALPQRQRIAAVVLSVGLLIVVLELVRRRKLREEYSLIWVVTSVVVVALALIGEPIVWVSRVIGAANPASTLFLGGMLFLLLLALQFSIRLSKLTYRNKALAQRIALLEEEVRAQRGPSMQTPDADRRRKGGVA